MSERIGNEDVVRFSLGREATGQELAKHAAGRTLATLAKQHQTRKGGSFVDALHAVAKICPGELRQYLSLEWPRGTSGAYEWTSGKRELADLWFREYAGWTEQGARDWLKQQGFSGGTLEPNDGGWAYVLRPQATEFPR